MTDDEERRKRRAEMLAKFRALPPDERERRLRALVEAIEPDFAVAVDDVRLVLDDVSDESGRAVYVETHIIAADDRALGLRLDDERMRKLVTWGQAWLDAPRLAARANPEIIHHDEGAGLFLLRTPFEWGWASEDAPEDSATWFTGEDAERDARRQYNGERDIESCCVCAAEIDDSDPGVGGCEDGALCPGCAEDAHQEWLASPVECTGQPHSTPPCGWKGKGADAAMVGEVSTRRCCPTCGGDVELVDEPAAVGEASES